MITKKTSIMEVLRLNSQAREILSRHGMGCIGCLASATETLEAGAKMHDVDIETLLKELNEAQRPK